MYDHKREILLSISPFRRKKTLDVKIDDLAKETGLSIGTVRTALKVLEVAGYIKTDKSRKCTIIKIIKQDKIKQVVGE